MEKHLYHRGNSGENGWANWGHKGETYVNSGFEARTSLSRTARQKLNCSNWWLGTEEKRKAADPPPQIFCDTLLSPSSTCKCLMLLFLIKPQCP